MSCSETHGTAASLSYHHLKWTEVFTGSAKQIEGNVIDQIPRGLKYRWLLQLNEITLLDKPETE